MLLQIFLYQCAFVSASVCPAYTCSGNSPTTNECISYSNTAGVDSYIITPCISGLECADSMGSSSMCSYSSQTRYPGEFCTSGLDCMSYNCISGKCVGLTTGQLCTSTSECNPGLYCSTSCVAQIKPGKSCTENEQCENNSICDEGVCIILFSGDINEPTQIVTPYGLAISCSTGFASNSTGTYKCAKAPVSNSTSVMNCTAGSQCLADKGESSKNCICGYDGQGRCPLFEGDSEVTQMISNFPAIAALSLGTCHASNPYSYECFSTMSSANLNTYLKWLANAVLYTDHLWVLKENNSVCVNQTLNAAYWNIYSQSLSTTAQCPLYSCTNVTAQWENTQCVLYKQDIYYDQISEIVQVHNCTSNFECMATEGVLSNSTCDIVINLRYPGEFCTLNEQCYTSLCKDYLCQGQKQGEVCVSAWNCNPGLYCGSTHLCEPLLTAGHACIADTDCTTFLICNLGTCTKAYSLSIGSQVASTSAYSKACMSGFATSNLTGSYCAAAPVSPSALRTCTPGTLCYDSTTTYSKPCTCGINGISYCPSFEGDIYLQDAIKAYSTLEQVGNLCNVVSGVNVFCFGNSTSNMLNYYYHSTNLTYYLELPYLQNQEDCMKYVFNQEFWTGMAYIANPYSPPKPPSPPSDDSARHFSLSAFLILAIYY